MCNNIFLGYYSVSAFQTANYVNNITKSKDLSIMLLPQSQHSSTRIRGSADARYEILFCFAFLGSQQALAARVRSGSRFAIELTWRQWVIHLWHHMQRPRKTVAHRSHSWCLAYAIAQPNMYDSESTQTRTHTCTQIHTLTRAGTRWRKIYTWHPFRFW